MKLVHFALRRPVSIVVIVIALAVFASLAVVRMPIDIFPNLGAPAIYVAQPYGGMDPSQMEGFLTYYFEYHFLYITGIEHVESKSIQGASLMKLVFHPGTDMSQAMAEVVGYVSRARAFMPPGTVGPFITRFDAGSVPVGQLVFTSSTQRPAGELQDIALNRVRPLFATLEGVSAPPPFGGNQKTVVVRVQPEKLRQYHLSPEEVITAVNRASTVLPAGNVRAGDLNYIASSNAVLGGKLDELLDAPVRDGVYLRDVATIETGTDIVTGYAHVNGKRTVYIQVTKRADASTLRVIERVKAALPDMRKVCPDDVNVTLEFDQSGYVSSAINNLASEGVLGAILTGLVVLLFLRDWRGALIVITTIPAALFSAVVALWAFGQTINIMTLGGLALAVGVLVDEATVEIENIHTHMATGLSRAEAVLIACRKTATPRLLALVAILAVFVPAYFMTGVVRQLFWPLALSVACAMVSSYLLSSSLVPVMATRLLREHRDDRPKREGLYGHYLDLVLRFRWILVPVYLVTTIGLLFLLMPHIGREVFPPAGDDLFQLRLQAPAGTRIEKTEKIALAVLDVIQREAGKENVAITTGFIGVQPPSYPINTIFLWTSGPQEAVLKVALKQTASIRGEALRERLRAALHKDFPDTQFSFEPGDIIGQVMSFGSSTPIEVAVQGPSLPNNRAHAAKVRTELAKVQSLRDLQYAQSMDYPTLDVKIDRQRAGQFGLSMSQVAKSMVAATSSSRFVEPNYWRDPASGNAFQIQVEIPYQRMDSIDALRGVPVMENGEARPLLGDLATVTTGKTMGMVERYNMQRVISLTANVHGVALSEAADEIAKAVKRAGEPPKGVTVRLRGQIPPLEVTQTSLKWGVLASFLAIFLLLSAFFESFRVSFSVLLTAPAVLLGVALSLWITGTTLNVQSFLGAIMATGIAVANSILLCSFAESARAETGDAQAAAREGALGRLRAVLMTATAMTCGMLPLALGSAQTAPLGRAVIGGLLLATVSTLTILPAVYALVMRGAKRRSHEVA
jgi:multidrug efflux pump subunit AcrB